MSEPHVLYDMSGGVATVTLNRPERHNALSPEAIVRLARAWEAARDDPAVSVVLATGAGDRSFCAGADLQLTIPLVTGARPAEDDWDEQLLEDRSLGDRALLRGVGLYKPVAAAMEMILGAEPVDAQWALRHELLNEVVAHEEVLNRATEVAHNVAKAAPIALAKSKEVALTTAMMSLDDAYRAEGDIADEVFATEDAREGPLAFMEKRQPRWHGK